MEREAGDGGELHGYRVRGIGRLEESEFCHQEEDLWKKANNRTLWQTMIAEVFRYGTYS